MKVENLKPHEVELLRERFHQKTLRVGTCLEWQGYRQNAGYGVLERRIDGRKVKVLAHRFAAKYIGGIDVADLDACHSCDNRKCVDDGHLFAGTRKQNMQDAVAKGRQAKGDGLPHTKLTEGQVHSIRADERDYESIASEYKTTSSTISNIKNLIEWSWLPIEGQIFVCGIGDRIAGEAHYCAKLDEQKVRRIRTSKESLAALASEFGVAYNTVHSALIGKTWRRVQPAANDNLLSQVAA